MEEPVPVSRARPSGNRFELAAWFFMRISGILLIFLVLGHVAIMHIVHDVADIDFDFVSMRWSNPWWRVYDWSMLLLAMVHGANGLRTVLEDYIQHRGWRLFALTSLWVITGFVLLIGTLVVILF